MPIPIVVTIIAGRVILYAAQKVSEAAKESKRQRKWEAEPAKKDAGGAHRDRP